MSGFKHKGTATDIGRQYQPGQGADLSDLEGLSGIAVGSNVPFGLVLWYGPEASQAQNAGALNKAKSAYYPGAAITVMLPFAYTNTTVTRADGTRYRYTDFQMDPATNLPVVAGIGVYSNAYDRLMALTDAELKGHEGNYTYAQKNCDSVTHAREGRIFVYVETDVDASSQLGYRIDITNPADEFQIRGAIGDINDPTKGSELTPLPLGWKVVKPSSAGGCARIEINN
jgi:hypothetical protein